MSLRAVLYARCSTEEETQKDALQKQVAEAKECAERMGWLLVDSYIESRSGTSTKGRTEYNRLYEDLPAEKFDVIVIKSQDRLMRNTKDWYLFVDRLTTSQKRLYIYIEQKFYSTDDALITGIKAILAEDYSRELSKKINNAHYNRQKNGGTVLLTNKTYGYRKLPDKSVALVEEEAKVKRQMYELCAAGYGSRMIAKILGQEGVTNRKGNAFTDSDIRRMIRNPLNKGTAVMHREHFDFDSKRTQKIPAEEWFLYENKVPAIVSDDLWQLANDEITRRAQRDTRYSPCIRGKNPGKAQFSGKLFCGLCGAPYYRTTRKTEREKSGIYEWSCRTYLQKGKGAAASDTSMYHTSEEEKSLGCNNIHLREQPLIEILDKKLVGHMEYDMPQVIQKVIKIMEDILEEDCQLNEMPRIVHTQEQIKKQISGLVDKLLDGVITDEVYQLKQKELENSLKEVQEKINLLIAEEANKNADKQRIAAIKTFLEEGGMKRVMLQCFVDNIEQLVVYPNYLECKIRKEESFYIEKSAAVVEGSEISDEEPRDMCCLRIDIGNTFQYLEKKKEEREAVASLMRENPHITARQIAGRLEISLSGANYRIRVLKREGRIKFHGAGGKGQWEVQKE